MTARLMHRYALICAVAAILTVVSGKHGPLAETPRGTYHKQHAFFIAPVVEVSPEKCSQDAFAESAKIEGLANKVLENVVVADKPPFGWAFPDGTKRMVRWKMVTLTGPPAAAAEKSDLQTVSKSLSPRRNLLRNILGSYFLKGITDADSLDTAVVPSLHTAEIILQLRGNGSGINNDPAAAEIGPGEGSLEDEARKEAEELEMGLEKAFQNAQRSSADGAEIDGDTIVVVPHTDPVEGGDNGSFDSDKTRRSVSRKHNHSDGNIASSRHDSSNQSSDDTNDASSNDTESSGPDQDQSTDNHSLGHRHRKNAGSPHGRSPPSNSPYKAYPIDEEEVKGIESQNTRTYLNELIDSMRFPDKSSRFATTTSSESSDAINLISRETPQSSMVVTDPEPTGWWHPVASAKKLIHDVSKKIEQATDKSTPEVVSVSPAIAAGDSVQVTSPINSAAPQAVPLGQSPGFDTPTGPPPPFGAPYASPPAAGPMNPMSPMSPMSPIIQPDPNGMTLPDSNSMTPGYQMPVNPMPVSSGTPTLSEPDHRGMNLPPNDVSTSTPLTP